MGLKGLRRRVRRARVGYPPSVFRDGNGPAMIAAVLVAGLTATLVSRSASTPTADGSARPPPFPATSLSATTGAAPAASEPTDADHWIAADFGGTEGHVTDVVTVTVLVPDPATSGFAGDFDVGI